MITMVGICAGQIWDCLEAHKGSLSLNALFSKIETSKEIAWMALGWLARQEYVLIHGSDFLNSTVCLKNADKNDNDSDN